MTLRCRAHRTAHRVGNRLLLVNVFLVPTSRFTPSSWSLKFVISPPRKPAAKTRNRRRPLRVVVEKKNSRKTVAVKTSQYYYIVRVACDSEKNVRVRVTDDCIMIEVFFFWCPYLNTFRVITRLRRGRNGMKKKHKVLRAKREFFCRCRGVFIPY